MPKAKKEEAVEEKKVEKVEADEKKKPVEKEKVEAEEKKKPAKKVEKDEEKEAPAKPKKTVKKKVEKPKIRSKKYAGAIGEFDKNKKYALDEAVVLLKKVSYSKFDGTVSLDIRLAKTKAEESIRGTVKLPHGIEKKIKIVVASDDLIEKIKNGEMDFDVLLSTPSNMSKLAKVAKILGPKGLMPNPKDGTVVEDPEKAKKEMAGMARYRADAHRNIHVAVGKVSWDGKKIIENTQVILKVLNKYKKDTVVLSPTMGAGIKIDL